MTAPTIEELVLADDPERWERLGFTVDRGCCQLGTVRLRFRDGGDARGIVGWSLRHVASTELDGLPTTRAPQTAPAGPAGVEERAGTKTSLDVEEPAGSEVSADSETPRHAHPNGVHRVDHVVAMSPDLDRSVAALEAAGLQLRRIREQPTPAGAPRQAFFRLGSEILELIQEPREILEGRGATDGAARFWGLALRTQDLDRTVALLGEHAGTIRPAVQPGRRIATLRRSAGIAVPLAFMSEP